MSARVDALIAAGAVQISRKHRKVFVPPKNPAQWLRDEVPDVYDRLVEETLQRFESSARSIVHQRLPDALVVQLSVLEFAEFYEKANARPLWTPEGKVPCPHCGSFGHLHRRDCPC